MNTTSSYSRKTISPLCIQEIPSSHKQFVGLQKQVDVWGYIADNKKAKTPISTEKDRFSTLASIATILSITLESREPSHQLLICTDKRSTVQSIALISNEPNRFFLKYLITNPNNIRSDLNSREPNRVTGAGTAIIHHLLKKCLIENKKSLQLYFTPDSEQFYRKLYFEIANSQSSNLMKFSSRKIEFLFINQRISQSNLRSLNWLDLALPTSHNRLNNL